VVHRQLDQQLLDPPSGHSRRSVGVAKTGASRACAGSFEYAVRQSDGQPRDLATGGMAKLFRNDLPTLEEVFVASEGRLTRLGHRHAAAGSRADEAAFLRRNPEAIAVARAQQVAARPSGKPNSRSRNP
jgi:hypothetical protein